MNIAHIEQDNILDGTPLIIDPHYEGTYFTISGREENPLILAMSTEDLKVYHDAYLDRLKIDAGEAFIAEEGEE